MKVKCYGVVLEICSLFGVILEVDGSEGRDCLKRWKYKEVDHEVLGTITLRTNPLFLRNNDKRQPTVSRFLPWEEQGI